MNSLRSTCNAGVSVLTNPFPDWLIDRANVGFCFKQDKRRLSNLKGGNTGAAMMDMQRKTNELTIKRFAFLDQMPEIGMAPFQISDYQLGPFDEERLGEYAPEFYLPDWCPPPPALTEAEMHELLEWVDREWDKGDLYPDPATYPFDDYFDREDLYVCKF